MKIEIPDIKKGSATIVVKGYTFAIYYVDGKQKRKSLGTVLGKAAEEARDAFFATLDATVITKKTASEKIAKNANRYIHYQQPYRFVYKGVVRAMADTKEEILSARKEYFDSLKATK